MPKTTKDIPKNFKPYISLGVNLTYSDDSVQGDAEACPFCDGSKFSVEKETSKYQCLSGSCAEVGNSTTFLRRLWEDSYELTQDYSELADARNIEVETLMLWNLARSIIDDTWIMPGYNSSGSLMQIYRYNMIGGKMRMLPTAGISHQLFGMNNFDDTKESVCLCEGPWDPMSWWEALRKVKHTNDGLVETANPNKSLLATTNVLGTPGCNVFNPDWISLFAGKVVHLMFDNDHPKNNKEPAALMGLKKIANTLLHAKDSPEQINYLCWGENGYDLNQPSGKDVRDLLNA